MAETRNRTTRNAMAELEAGKGEPFDVAELGREVKFRRYDVVNYLQTEDDIAAYLDAVMEDGDPALIASALGDVARARAQIATKADSDHQSQ